MKILKVLFYFLLGGVIGFSINFTWSLQQNLITFSLAFLLYSISGYFASKNEIGLFSHKVFLLFWYIILLVSYASIVNYSWDLPILISICIISFVLSYYLQKIKNRKPKLISFFTYTLLFVLLMYLFVPWFTYEKKTNIEFTNQKIEYRLKSFNNYDSIVSDSTLKGKVVLFDFWYKSCGVCIRQYPKMEAVYNHFKNNKNVAIYFVNNGIDSIETINDFVKNKNIQIPILIDKNSSLVKKLKLNGFPVFVLIDKKGIIKEMHMGYSRDEATVFEEQTINKIDQILNN